MTSITAILLDRLDGRCSSTSTNTPSPTIRRRVRIAMAEMGR